MNGARPGGSAAETAAGIARIEGYLLCQAEERTARTEAEVFAARMPWLTTGQREEVVRLYTAERMALSRRVLSGVARRCRDLEEEYAVRYRTLRARTLRGATAAVLCCLSITAGTVLVGLLG